MRQAVCGVLLNLHHKSDLLTLSSVQGSAPNFPNKVAQYESEYPDLYSITLYELIMLLKRNGRLLERPNVSHFSITASEHSQEKLLQLLMQLFC